MEHHRWTTVNGSGRPLPRVVFDVLLLQRQKDYPAPSSDQTHLFYNKEKYERKTILE